MLKTCYASCLGLLRAILAQFALELCEATQICKKNLFQGLRSFNVIDVDTASACYAKRHVCAYMQPFSC